MLWRLDGFTGAFPGRSLSSLMRTLREGAARRLILVGHGWEAGCPALHLTLVLQWRERDQAQPGQAVGSCLQTSGPPHCYQVFFRLACMRRPSLPTVLSHSTFEKWDPTVPQFRHRRSCRPGECRQLKFPQGGLECCYYEQQLLAGFHFGNLNPQAQAGMAALLAGWQGRWTTPSMPGALQKGYGKQGR